MYQNFQNPQQYSQPFNSGFNAFNNNAFQNQQKVSIPQVNGRSGAEAYILPPDSSILLMDTTAPRVWLKKTDSGGYASTQPFIITKEKDAEEQKTERLEERISKLEETINELKSQSQYQSNAFNVKQSNTNRSANNRKVEEQQR